jgi:hypothetical protein
MLVFTYIMTIIIKMIIIACTDNVCTYVYLCSVIKMFGEQVVDQLLVCKLAGHHSFC